MKGKNIMSFDFSFTDDFMSNRKNKEFARANMMGPNAMRISEERASHVNIESDNRLLDLGCGWGLSTLFLVKKFGATVFAADLWIPPTQNFERFLSYGIDDKAIPISVDAANGLPFSDGYFDMLFSVDSYHYFGDTPEMLPSLIPHVKKGGYIAIAIPGLKEEFGDNIPEEMKPFWEPEVARTIRSLDWWKTMWIRTAGIEIIDISEMECCSLAWDEWLACTNPFAVEDVAMMEAEGGKYFNLVQLIAKVL
jgi:cyclopropane fatty-acyl-phospholipid synthase-like methyltransferase